jgi:hypothetical protein
MNQVVYKTEKSLYNNIKASISKEALSGAFCLNKKELEIKTNQIIPKFINKREH